jgi:hypothetical protein
MAKKKARQNTVPVSSGFLEFIRVAAGPGFVLAGYGIMLASFWAGVCLVYLGALICLAEAIWDPRLLDAPYRIQVSVVGLIFALVAFFTINVVGADAPLGVLSYPGGNDPNPHIADIYVALNDSSPDDYGNLNIVISPDAWTHKASISQDPNGCVLSPEPGDTIATAVITKAGKDAMTANNAFGQFSLRDSLGNTFTTMAYQNGYRLTCATVRSHLTTLILFESASPNDAVMKSLPSLNLKSGQWGVSAGEFTPSSPGNGGWDFLGPKPHPSFVSISGTYKKGERTYRINEKVKIAN